MERERLTIAEFHILLSLADSPRHGLGIVEEVELRTDGDLVLGPGLLYGSLKRMARTGLVEDVEAPDDADPRRRYYRLTTSGRDAAREEAARWSRTLEMARDKAVLDDGVAS